MLLVVAHAPAAFADPNAVLAPDGDEVTSDLISIQKDGTQLFRREARAVRRTDEIAIDGKLSEPAWERAPKVHYDWQESPNEGAAATGPTEFRVLYDDDAVYIGIHALDREPDKIRAVLHPSLSLRKVPQSDWLIVLLDPRLNRRMAYGFAVNPLGVTLDIRSFADTGGVDDSYAPVWNVRTSRDATGWFAEIRVPHSQTRVRNGYQDRWGFQVLRRFARTQERSYWSPFTFRSGMDVKGYGNLAIEDTLSVGRPLELRPYLLGGARVTDVAPEDQLNPSLAPAYKIGLDATFQAFDRLKLTATINPDFGQVEADPSEVNLTDQETFFSERRPFFVQDDDLYRFNVGRGVETLFYSRRIGARPRLSQAATAAFVERRDTTTILGALKMSGELGTGLHLATLSAVTREETARFQRTDGSIDESVVEPLTAYNVVELFDTFRGGASELRAAATATNRALGSIETLHKQAYTGGLQYLHQFRANKWALFAMIGGSYVEGDAPALELTQRASRRYFQRPDATHVAFDPDRTSLAGTAFNAQLKRIAGLWQGEVGVDGRSPGFEANDVGFQVDADVINPFARVQYLDSTVTSGAFREKSASLSLDTFTDFAPDVLRHQVSSELRGVMRGNSTLTANAAYSHGVLDTRLLRGGPAVHGEDAYTLTLSRDGDQSQDVAIGVNARGQLRPASSSWQVAGGISLRWNILSNLEVLFAPDLRRTINNTQFVGGVADPAGGTHYLLGELAQWEARATTRVELTLTPRMSLQLYAEPFVSAGRFARLLEASAPRAATYDARFAPLDGARVSESASQIQVDTDGDGVLDATIPQPDFRVGSLLTNLVFRWEYRPGSLLHLIWSHGQRSRVSDGSFMVVDALEGPRAHVVLAKLSYWWNP